MLERAGDIDSLHDCEIDIQPERYHQERSQHVSEIRVA